MYTMGIIAVVILNSPRDGHCRVAGRQEESLIHVMELDLQP